MNQDVIFETHPDRYAHWKLSFEGPIATLAMAVAEDRPIREGYALKLNSYDLGVDIELADAIERIRFEHPEVQVVVITSVLDRVFCAGANIQMLGASSHTWKVNFCKFTNETRLHIEDASAHSGLKTIAALNGIAAGGGYELALACDRIVLVDDGSSVVSLPEVPLLGVLPGTGGLTRVTDKRKVRRDLADVFCSNADGVKGKRALAWGLVDAILPRSTWDEGLAAQAEALAAMSDRGGDRTGGRAGEGMALTPLQPEVSEDALRYSQLTLELDASARVASLRLSGPTTSPPESPEALRALGSSSWVLRVWRELDDALLRLRQNAPEIGTLVIRTEGDPEKLLAWDRALHEYAKTHWAAREILLKVKRVLKRLDVTSRSIIALIEPGACFAGSFAELALAADRSYMLDDPARPNLIHLGVLNAGALPMGNGLTRLASRFLARPDTPASLLAREAAFDAAEAAEAGLVTFAPDDIDWDDEVRLAVEERAALSPDALTGLEANLRFAGAETMETKIFGRLSAWQNWIFQRPNAVGEKGALTLHGKGERPVFDFKRT